MDEEEFKEKNKQLEAELLREKRQRIYETRQSEIKDEVVRNEMASLKGWIALIIFCIVVIALGL